MGKVSQNKSYLVDLENIVLFLAVKVLVMTGKDKKLVLYIISITIEGHRRNHKDLNGLQVLENIGICGIIVMNKKYMFASSTLKRKILKLLLG